MRIGIDTGGGGGGYERKTQDSVGGVAVTLPVQNWPARVPGKLKAAV